MKRNKGITLIALIITIIIMLILVGVTVQVVIESELIGVAQDAGNRTEMKYQEEKNLGNVMEIDGKEYLSMEDYLAGKEKLSENMEGEGTEENPYTIDSIEALVQFANSITNGKTYEGEYVNLTKDLDFKSANSYVDCKRTDYEEYGYTGELMTALTTGEGFKPIGSVSGGDNTFKGNFDGNNCSISNLYMNKLIESGSAYQLYGLFSVNDGIIKNLTVTAEIEFNATYGNICVGEIAGIVRSSGTIQNCTSYGSICVTGSDQMQGYIAAGGIAGQLSRGRIEKCKNYVGISGEKNAKIYLGGINGSNQKGSIYDSYNTGKIVAEKYDGLSVSVGGIAGTFTQGIIDGCFNIGEVISNGSVGGIVGYLDVIAGTYTEITNCVYNNSGITGVAHYPNDKFENDNVKVVITKNENLTEKDILENI